MPELLESVPNFSEGRDQGIVQALTAAAENRGAHLLDTDADPDHNRVVVTLVGFSDSLLEGLLAAIATAAKRIHLPRHAGLHPRVGAADVVPFVPLNGGDLEPCIGLAHSLGQRVWKELGIPVYFYAAAARRETSRTLASIRSGRSAPDLGSGEHPTAGSVCIGARRPLVAYNVLLPDASKSQAAELARRIRFASGGLPGVQALAFNLGSRGFQLSMNLFELSTTTPAHALQELHRLAADLGLRVGPDQLVGLCPAEAASESAGGRLLEARLAAAAAMASARNCRRGGGAERVKVAKRLEEAAARFRLVAPTLEEMLAAAEQAVAVRNVVAAAGCLEPESEAMLMAAASGLRKALGREPPSELRRRVGALDAWRDRIGQ